MALIKCPECGKEISDQAPACIHCGFPLNKQKEPVQQDEPILSRKKVNALIPIIIYVLIDTIIGLGFTLSIIFMDRYFWGIFVGVEIMLVFFTIVSIFAMVDAIVERAKNNNRLDINLIEYSKDKNELILRNHKDKTLTIEPQSFRFLDGKEKAFLYYYETRTNDGKIKNTQKMFVLGYAEKDDINKARELLNKLKNQ